MTAYCTKGIKDGDEMIILIPDEIAFDDDAELVVVRDGDCIRIFPATEAGYLAKNRDLARTLLEMPGPSEIEVRDAEEIPEPKGL